jgi:hypothetical protein
MRHLTFFLSVYPYNTKFLDLPESAAASDVPDSLPEPHQSDPKKLPHNSESERLPSVSSASDESVDPNDEKLVSLDNPV